MSTQRNMNSAIQAREVSKQVSSGGTPLTILEAVSLEVAAGESLAIIGKSGSGKTTLLSLLAGLDTPSSGTILLDGAALEQMDEEQRAAHRAGRVGFVFQSFQLLEGFTALENVMLPAEIAGHDDAGARAGKLLAQVGLAERTGHYPAQLSGGEQQRVAVARAFAGEPSILFADEPTGNLDTDTGARVIELLFQLNQARNTTLVLVTHDPALAQRCDRTLTLSAGKLVCP